MKQILLFILVLAGPGVHAQESISEEVRKYVEYERGNYLLQNLVILDGAGNSGQEDVDIWIEGEIIKQIGKDLPVPLNATVLDLSGKSATPGFVMLHEHMFYPKSSPDPAYGLDQMSYSFPLLYLAGGVTMMRTAGSIMPQADVNLKKWINQGKIAGPKIDVTSPHMDREGLPIVELFTFDDAEEARNQVDFYADLGTTSIKVYNFISREDLKAIVDAAHARNMKVTGHLCSVTYREAADIGIDNIEHGFGSCPDFLTDKIPDQCDPFMQSALIQVDPESAQVKDLINHLIQKKVALTTTINVWDPYTGREVVPGGGIKALSPLAKENVYQRWNSKQGKDSVDYLIFNKLKILDKKFHDAGGLLVAGTDPTYDGRIVPGYANMRLLEILVEMGFTIPQAVKICTLNGAKYLELDQSIGTIESGKLADLIIMSKDITKDVSAIRSEKIVFKNGIGYNSEKLFKAAESFVGIR
ncbi:MAG: amidohydrolase family protein [Saprospiraceae bacterium]|nr:amidohydrolase family protein [Saprospiraceae bacterium]